MPNTPSSFATVVSELTPGRRDWLRVGTALALGLAVFGYIFRREIATAISSWQTSDAYNHCFLVLPVAAYLAWERREAIMATLPRPAPWLAVLAVPAAAAWFVADRLGIMEGRQLTAMTLFEIMVLAALGWAAWREFATPLLYLYFLVPFGDFIVGPMQILVVHFTTIGLKLLGIPTFTDGVAIQIPEGSFLVHQACSGLRFLIASAAFGVLYSCIMYTSPVRRIVFSLLALVLAIVGNCFRVLGTILIAHYWGNVHAVEADHVIWGWGFYVIIGGLLILIGFRFGQEAQRTPVITPATGGRVAGPAAAAVAIAVLFAVVPSVAADYMDNVGASSNATLAGIPMPTVAGCSGPLSSAPAATDHAPGNEGVSAEYRCGDERFTLTVYGYPPRLGARPLFLAYKAAESPPGGGDIMETSNVRPTGSDAPTWQVSAQAVDNYTRYAAVARSLWINGQPTGGGLMARLEQALNSVRRNPEASVLAVVTHYSGSLRDTGRETAAFLAKTGAWTRWVNGWLPGRGSG